MSEAAPPAPLPRKQNYGWVWYFAFLIVASVGVMFFMIWFNLSIQLTPEQFETAKTRWQEADIKNYNMIYTERHSNEGAEKSTVFAVKVRGGKVQEVLMNGKPLVKNEEQTDDPRIFHSMDSLYRNIERFLEMDGRPKAPRVYATLKSDEKNGRVIEYIRRVMGTKHRVQITVERVVVLDAGG